MNILSISKLRRAAHRMLRRFSDNAIILMYHRVGEPGLDPWSLCVTSKHFQEHLEVLQKYAQPMGLRQLAQSHRNGTIPHHAVAITFDDGYADNLYNAKPLLERYGIPATVFVSTGNIGQEQEFWWDELEQLLLRPSKLPEKLTLTIQNTKHFWELSAAANYSEDDYEQDYGRKPWEGKPGSRLYFYYSIWQTLRFLPSTLQFKLLDEIRNWVNTAKITRSTHRPLSPEEVCILKEGELVEIGAHTVTHPFLSAHSLGLQLQEIQQSKGHLEELLKLPVTSFAYPYGNYAPQTVPLVQKAGLECACTTAEEVVWNNSDSFQLPRFQVYDWDREEFTQQLRKWLYF